MGRHQALQRPGIGAVAGGVFLPLGVLTSDPARDLAVGSALVLAAAAAGIGLMLLRARRALHDRDELARTLREQNDRMRSITLHDPLTGLANRTRFTELLNLALRRLERASGVVGVLYLDLDGFKEVNDELGHARGDELLIEVSRRLSGLVSEGDRVARIGGDEFTILCCDMGGDTEIVELAQRVRAAIDSPFTLSGHVARVSASVGLAVTDDPSCEAESILGEADVAMYEVKRHGGRAMRVFDLGTRRRVVSRRRLEEDLRTALRSGALEVLYQPLLCLATQQACGLEAFARWSDRANGPVSPQVFVPMADSLGLGRELVRVVLRDAIATLPLAELAFGRPIPIAVNVSFRQLGHRDTVDVIEDEITRAGVAPRLISLDVGGLPPADPAATALQALIRLREMGISVSVDDFGDTAISLGALRRLSIDALKIDASLVSGIGGEADDAIVQAIIRLARGLGVRAVAEGVETRAQHAKLTELGCHEAQGRFYCPPLKNSRLDAARAIIGATLRKGVPRVSPFGDTPSHSA